MRHTTMRLLLAALTVVGLVVVANTTAAGDTTTTDQQAAVSTPTPAPAATPPKPVCAKPWQHNRLARRALRYAAPDGDFYAHIPTRHQLHRLAMMRKCVKHAGNMKAYGKMHRYWKHRHKTWRFYRYIDEITPYGKWAIPPYIVECESHGSWNAANPSGAVGPYQLLGWGAPYPARTPRAQAENHMIAARVYNGGRGRSNWVC